MAKARTNVLFNPDVNDLLLKEDTLVKYAHMLRDLDKPRYSVLTSTLFSAGFEVYIGGGVTRNYIEGKKTYEDIDLLGVRNQADCSKFVDQLRTIKDSPNDAGRFILGAEGFEILNMSSYTTSSYMNAYGLVAPIRVQLKPLRSWAEISVGSPTPANFDLYLLNERDSKLFDTKTGQFRTPKFRGITLKNLKKKKNPLKIKIL